MAALNMGIGGPSSRTGHAVNYDDNIAIIHEETSRLSPDGETLNNAPRKPTVHIQEPPVSDMRGYEVVKIVEKHGPFHSAIPVMPLPLAILFCLLNIVLPGTGKSSDGLMVLSPVLALVSHILSSFGSLKSCIVST